MSIEAAFDIQQVRNSSVKQKNALQAEWQETIREVGSANSSDAANFLMDLTIEDEKFPTMLPNVALAFNYRNRMQSNSGNSAKSAKTGCANVVQGLSSTCVADFSH